MSFKILQIFYDSGVIGPAIMSAVTQEPSLHATLPYTINYMQRIGTNQFRWPNVADALLTNIDDILSKVQPPVPSYDQSR